MKRVLIVDDAAFMRTSLTLTLEKNGFEVVGAAINGFEGIIKYKELYPDVVTMDITMPEMNGIDCLKQILAIDSKAKIVIVSAIGQEERVKESIICGAKSFIVKPFSEETLLKVLNKVLAL